MSHVSRGMGKWTPSPTHSHSQDLCPRLFSDRHGQHIRQHQEVETKKKKETRRLSLKDNEHIFTSI